MSKGDAGVVAPKRIAGDPPLPSAGLAREKAKTLTNGEAALRGNSYAILQETGHAMPASLSPRSHEAACLNLRPPPPDDDARRSDGPLLQPPRRQRSKRDLLIEHVLVRLPPRGS